eukprot:3311112-Alexandrium_andersonii.AAC.1
MLRVQQQELLAGVGVHKGEHGVGSLAMQELAVDVVLQPVRHEVHAGGQQVLRGYVCARVHVRMR